VKKIIFSTLLVIYSNILLSQNNLINSDIYLDERHSVISQRITKLIEDLHYSRPRLDNAFSSEILDKYLDTLDTNRLYFQSNDINSFSKYRYEIDNLSKDGNLDFIFEIFTLLKTRTEDRINFAIQLLEEEPDFSVDESFIFDRRDMTWPKNDEEINSVWRKRIKNDALGLILTGKTWEETSGILETRYKRIQTSILQLTADDIFETFVNSLANTMDPHSNYFSPRNSEEYRIQMSLSYEGIGASLRLDNEYVTVINVIPGGPAQIDGQLKPEDRITAVGQGDLGELVDVIGWRLDDVVDIIRGPGGTVVKLQILPGGSPPGSNMKILDLTRDQVKLEEQAAKKELHEININNEDFNIGVIKIPSFYQDFEARNRGDENYKSTSRDVTTLLNELKLENIDGLVIDLRGNGGGHLSEATELTGLFVDYGPIVQLREARGNIQVLNDPSNGAIYDGPLAVLVDRFSASASEIFAAAIQDYGRGIVIGQQTYGKGSVQNLFMLDQFIRSPGNGQITLTIGKYYRITGASTQNRGVTPDIELPSIIDKYIIGESNRDNSLSWDQVSPTRFSSSDNLDDEIAILNHYFNNELAQDPNIKYLLKNIEQSIVNSSKKIISLNLTDRKNEQNAQREKVLANENERRKELNLEQLNDIEELSLVEDNDILLEQSAKIIAKMSTIEPKGSWGRNLTVKMPIN
tara:strand:- start:8681 stop:10756 length:2076 start_codon:yes stop_codon:yes gene_type:complete